MNKLLLTLAAIVAFGFTACAQKKDNQSMETRKTLVAYFSATGTTARAAKALAEVSGGTLDQYRTFYSCLYRSVLFPRKFYEVTASGEIVHYSPYNGEVLPGYMYTDTGFWDTFRALFPLLNLVYPSVNAEIQAGLANTYRESGFLPEWASPGHRGCMVGNNSASGCRHALRGDACGTRQGASLGKLHRSPRTRILQHAGLRAL